MDKYGSKSFGEGLSKNKTLKELMYVDHNY